MLPLLIAAAFLGCDPPRQVAYGYARSYAAPAYYRPATYYQPQQYQAQAPAYYQPQQYQQPTYNYSLVGDYLKQESAHDKAVEQNAKLDVLIKLMADRATPPPVQQARRRPRATSPSASPRRPARSRRSSRRPSTRRRSPRRTSRRRSGGSVPRP
jgi:hypothetical protein